MTCRGSSWPQSTNKMGRVGCEGRVREGVGGVEG